MLNKSKTQLIQFTDQESGWKSPQTIYRPDEKAKKVPQVETDISIKGNT